MANNSKLFREDWKQAILDCLSSLSPSEFTHLGIAQKIGCSPTSLRLRTYDLKDIHDCFEFSNSHERWLGYNHDKLIEEAMKLTKITDLEKIMRMKYGCKFNGDRLKHYLKPGYRLSSTRHTLIYQDTDPLTLDIELLSYLIGYFIGDGSYHSNKVSWYTTKPDNLNRFTELLPLCVFRSYRDPQYFHELSSYSENLYEYFINLGIPHRKTYQDYTIKDIEKLSLPDLLAGLIDSDGWATKSFYVEVTSALLADQLASTAGSGMKRLSPKLTENCVMSNFVLDFELSKQVQNSPFIIKKLSRELLKETTAELPRHFGCNSSLSTTETYTRTYKRL